MSFLYKLKISRMRVELVLVILTGFLVIVLGKVYFEENFDDDLWSTRWKMSQGDKKEMEFGEFASTAGDFFANASNKGIITTKNESFYVLSTSFPEFSNENKTLVLQYSVKYEKDIGNNNGCINAFIELFDCSFNRSHLNSKSPYLIKFGPGVCSHTKKLHVTFQQKSKNYPINRYISWTSDVYTHVYTLIVGADDGMYEILIDGRSVHSGNLEADFSVPPKKIQDPTRTKPENWDDRRFINDPTDKKPDDWDQPETIINPNPPEHVLGGKYQRIRNPKYKGKWKARQIENPAYMGIWIHPQIDNPEYFAIHKFPRICGVGFNFWQSASGTIFDNILLTDDVAVAEKKRKCVLEGMIAEKLAKSIQDGNETEIRRLTEEMQMIENQRKTEQEGSTQEESRFAPEKKDEEQMKADKGRKTKEEERKAMATTPKNDGRAKDYERKQDELNEKLMTTIYIATSLVVLTILIGVISIYFSYRYRTKYLLSRGEVSNFLKGSIRSKGTCENNVPLMEVNGGAENQPYNKNKYEVAPSLFKIDSTRHLGHGGFGTVCCGSIKRGNAQVNVAVKMMNESSTTSYALKGLISEIKILSYVGEHDNILKMEGAYTAKLRKGKLFVFLELCEMGSLDNYLRSYNLRQKNQTNENCLPKFKPQKEAVTSRRRNTILVDGMFNDLQKWSYEIACAMEFLASKQIVHADLATRNVLLNAAKCAKIADFGLSRRLYNYTQYTKSETEPLPWRWMAPESLRKMIFNEKTDVWAFGVTLWEIFTLADEPYPGLSWDINFSKSLECGLRLPEPPHNQGNTYDVMKRCWEICADERPTFSQLKTILNV